MQLRQKQVLIPAWTVKNTWSNAHEWRNSALATRHSLEDFIHLSGQVETSTIFVILATARLLAAQLICNSIIMKITLIKRAKHETCIHTGVE